MYGRVIEKNIKEKIGTGKAIIVVGARQVGKTTLIKKILKGKNYLWNVNTKNIHHYRLKIFNRKVFEKVKRKMLSSAAADDKRKKTLPENDS